MDSLQVQEEILLGAKKLEDRGECPRRIDHWAALKMCTKKERKEKKERGKEGGRERKHSTVEVVVHAVRNNAGTKGRSVMGRDESGMDLEAFVCQRQAVIFFFVFIIFPPPWDNETTKYRSSKAGPRHCPLRSDNWAHCVLNYE